MAALYDALPPPPSALPAAAAAGKDCNCNDEREEMHFMFFDTKLPWLS